MELEASYHDKVDRLQVFLLAQPQVDAPLVHRFTPGIYMRELTIPAGSIIISEIHKTQHPFVVLKGKIAIMNESGTPVIIEAPYFGITEPGTRRVGYAHEDTVWMTMHATNKTDLKEIEDEVIEKREISNETERDVLDYLQNYVELLNS